jgi:acetylornithine deacetylase/succinyl-diaminopimelate desuccinylase-like protein
VADAAPAPADKADEYVELAEIAPGVEALALAMHRWGGSRREG